MNEDLRWKYLMAHANPIEWDSLSFNWPDKFFKKHRYLDCPYYSGCLDYTAELHWNSWSCVWCQWNPHKGKEEKSLRSLKAVQPPKPQKFPLEEADFKPEKPQKKIYVDSAYKKKKSNAYLRLRRAILELEQLSKGRKTDGRK